MGRRLGTGAAMLAAGVLMLAAPTGSGAAGESAVESLTLAAGPSATATGTVLLKAGVRYHIVVSGTATQALAPDSFSSDAIFCFQSSTAQCNPPAETDDAIGFALQNPGAPAPAPADFESINRFGEGTTAQSAYDAAHRYDQHLTPAADTRLVVMTWPGKSAGATVAYSGSFAVEVFEPAVPADAGCTGWSQPGNRGSSCALAMDTDLSYAPPAAGRVLRTTSPELVAGSRKVALSATLTGIPASRVAAAFPIEATSNDLRGVCVFAGLARPVRGFIRIPRNAPAGQPLELSVALACIRHLRAAITGPAPAAAGCNVSFIPVIRAGATMKPARRRTIVSFVAHGLRTTCRRRPGTLAFTVTSHGTTVALAFSPHMRIGLVRSGPASPVPADSGLVLRWHQ